MSIKNDKLFKKIEKSIELNFDGKQSRFSLKCVNSYNIIMILEHYKEEYKVKYDNNCLTFIKNDRS